MDSPAVLNALRQSRDVIVAIDAQGLLTFRSAGAEGERGDACAAALRTAIAADQRMFEWDHLDERGVRAWFASEALLIEGTGVLCISHDVTAQKRAETRLRRSEQLMVDTQGVAHLGTWEWDISQPTATWSRELYRIYGLTPETYTPSYEMYLTMVHPDDRQRVIDATNRVFHEHVPYSHDERIFLPDGTMRYLHTWAYPVLDDTGKLTHLIGVCQDITDRAAAEAALHRANVELEQRVSDRTRRLETAMRDLEAFNQMVSHDLRAPLAVIQMGADMIAKEPTAADGERIPKYVERIRRAVRNMSGLLNDLLAFARVGEGALHPAEIDVSAVCHEIIADLRNEAAYREATATISPGMRRVADPGLFRVVLANLLGNAWKYTQQQPLTKIEVGELDDATRTLFIRDNGVGFDMAEYKKLFVPFERLSTSKDFHGSGVGLATVQRILERHGGTIRAESTPGQGATFYVTLP